MSAVLRRFRQMKVVPVPVRQDNYSYLLIDDATRHAAAVDPFDVPKLQAAAAQPELDVRIIANITTHHHFDHSGGNKVFLERPFPAADADALIGICTSNGLSQSFYDPFRQALRFPSAPIYGGSDKVQALTKLVKDKDEFFIGDNIHVK